MDPQERNELPELIDEAVVLRAWRDDDAEAVFEACQDPEIARWTDIPQPYTQESARSFVQRARGNWHNGQGAAFAIVDRASGRVVGSMTLHGPDGHRAMLGYWLHPAGRGKGLASRALRLISDWALATLDVVRLETYAMVENFRSMRVMERAGFQREGVLRKWDTHRGEPCDVVFYSRLADE